LERVVILILTFEIIFMRSIQKYLSIEFNEEGLSGLLLSIFIILLFRKYKKSF
jgi:hypothetical protein